MPQEKETKKPKNQNMRNRQSTPIILILMTLLSRVVGFVRDASLAWLLGGTPLADAFTLAMRVPTVWRRLLAEGSLSLSLTSLCVRYPKNHPLMKKLAYRLFISLVLFTACAYLFRSDIITLLAPNAPEKTQSNALELFSLTLPYCLFASLAAWRMARHHADGQYFLPACAPIIYSSLLTGTALVCLMNMPMVASLVTPLATATSLRTAAFSMATAVLFGGAAQWLIQYLPSSKPVHTASPSASFAISNDEADPPKAHFEARPEIQIEAHSSARFLILGIFIAAIPQLAFCFAAALVSGFGAGHVAALYYAERLIEFPLGLFSVTATILTTPQLTRLIQQHNPKQTTKSIERILLLACCLTLPAACGLMAIAEPAVRVLFEHGSFTAPMTQITSRSLMAYSLAIPAYALSRPLITLCTSTHTQRTLIIASIVSLCVIALASCLLTSTLGSIGAPLGVAVGLWIYTFILWKIARKQYLFALPVRSLGVIVLSAALSFAGAKLTLHLTKGLFPEWGSLLLSLLVGVVAYMIVLLSKEIRDLFQSKNTLSPM